MNRLIASIFLLIPSTSFAFFCPNNFSLVNIGDTLAKVQQACGKPDTQKEKQIEPEGPQEWTYFIPQTVALDAMNQAQGTLKTTVDFDASGKAINISVNGIGVGASSVCGPNIQLGDTRDKIKTACGDPSYINKQTPKNGKPETIKETEFTYKSNPPVTLIFENGMLKEKK